MDFAPPRPWLCDKKNMSSVLFTFGQSQLHFFLRVGRTLKLHIQNPVCGRILS